VVVPVAPSGAPPYEKKYGALHGQGRAAVGSNNTTKFSEVWAVASRNSLYPILAINVALEAGQRAKSCSPRPIDTGVRDKAGEIATANFVEFLFHALR
jgi:hypothetical protein